MSEYLKLKVENWNFYVKHLEFEILKTKLPKLGCVNTKSWKLKIEIFWWNFWKKILILKIEMFEFGCVNTESWKLKIEIENVFVQCLEGIWSFEN
jgi:hypothetical protein